MRTAAPARFSAALLIVFVGLLSAAGNASAETAPAPAPAADIVPERIMGSADAPITVQEFVSLTCSHCAAFYTTVLPDLEEKYVKTGKVRFILRDFPLDGIALRAAALARCMPAEQYYAFVNVLFKNQQQWAFGTTPIPSAIQYAKLGGLSEDKAKACVDDPKMLDAIANNLETYKTKYDVKATPTFVINDGKETLQGAVPAADFAAKFDAILAEPKK